jgi:4-amino-4-deoxy-L-arabinose transferase-like glycosyltransferase
MNARARCSSTGSPLALAPLLLFAALVAFVLLAFAGGYGYHRDELYFLVAGRHLAWAYPDQGPVTPLLAHLIDGIAPGSLTALRAPSALMAGATTLVTGLICFELGGTRRAQLIAAACAGVASIVLVTGHLLSTTTLDLLAWSLVSWLISRALRTEREALWLAAGAVAGIALLNKPLIAFLLLSLGAGLLIAGPRAALRRRWLWAGLALALALWSPWLIWQGAHGWPQLEVSSSIASGGSASSQPRWALLPFQLLLVSPLLAPVWIAGLLALARDPQLRSYRFFAIAWVVQVVIFLATGGKPYYLAGMFPVLLAAGAIRTDAWLMRGHGDLRRALLVAAIGLSGLVSAVIALPILPEGEAGSVVAVNGDVGETIGWPELTRTVARVFRQVGRPSVILTSNYGEAGAIDRFGKPLGLPQAYSGHNGFAEWGPPPDRASPVVVVGLTQAELEKHFLNCHLVARVSNPSGIDNDERGEPIEVCDATRGAWSQIWSSLRRLG